MKKTAIFYGSTSGNCEGIANKIGDALGVTDIFSASQLDAAKIAEYDNLLLGSSTWGCGDLQDDWYDGVELLKSSNLADKTVAVFGCGDSCGFSNTYCDAMGTIWQAAKEADANLIGAVSTDGYSYDDSTAVVNGNFVGLALDEDNESDKTDERIAAWVEEIKPLL
ncbi:MAG: flavodoxin FldA [Prevotella sp.]|nr:flavodoxin FldA [Prevotella sp.]MCM1075013.1 flavodoxin FldA [Ruminococcus sp.]